MKLEPFATILSISVIVTTLVVGEWHSLDDNHPMYMIAVLCICYLVFTGVIPALLSWFDWFEEAPWFGRLGSNEDFQWGPWFRTGMKSPSNVVASIFLFPLVLPVLCAFYVACFACSLPFFLIYMLYFMIFGISKPRKRVGLVSRETDEKLEMGADKARPPSKSRSSKRYGKIGIDDSPWGDDVGDYGSNLGDKMGSDDGADDDG